MGGPMPDCRFKVSAHAHAEVLEIIAPGNLAQELKMLFRILIDGRNAHEARDAKSVAALYLSKFHVFCSFFPNLKKKIKIYTKFKSIFVISIKFWF